MQRNCHPIHLRNKTLVSNSLDVELACQKQTLAQRIVKILERVAAFCLHKMTQKKGSGEKLINDQIQLCLKCPAELGRSTGSYYIPIISPEYSDHVNVCDIPYLYRRQNANCPSAIF
jgi:hypothetical protein